MIFYLNTLCKISDTLHLFTLRDLPNLYANLRTSFAHGGMLGIANYGRRIQGFDGRPDLFEKLQDPRKTLGHKNLYFDTLVHDTHTLELDNRVKITNLPRRATIRIFTVSGTEVRTLTKDNSITSIDWDLKNNFGIPIASGLYVIHINAPGVGEKVIKWFGALRPIDLDTF